MRFNHLLMASVLGLFVAMPSYADVANTAHVSKSTDKVVATNNHASKVDGDMTQVNINTADAKTISKVLKGIGFKRAEAIVTYRTKNGPFKSVADLTNIKGISKKVLEKNTGKILLG